MGNENMPVTKIYCDDRGNNDAALIAAMNNRHGNNDMAAAMWMNNNPMMYLVWAMMMRFMGNGWDNNGNGQLNTIQNQLQDNHNNDLVMAGLNGNLGAIRELSTTLNCDFNALNSAVCAVREAVTAVGGQVGLSAERVINAVNLGNTGILAAVKDCCCSTQLQMCQQTNQLQRGQDFINRSVERGFSDVGNLIQVTKCDLLNAGKENTNRIIDTLNSHWAAENERKISDLKFELSQSKQNQYLLNALRGGNCGCGCGNGCGNGCGYGNNGCGCN